MTDSFITRAEPLLAAAISPGNPVRLHQFGGYVQAMSSYEAALFDALEGLLGEYKRLTTEGPWEYGVRALFDDGEEYESWGCASREEAERESLKLQGREDRRPPGDHPVTYSVWRRRMIRNREWVPVEGEDQ